MSQKLTQYLSSRQHRRRSLPLVVARLCRLRCEEARGRTDFDGSDGGDGGGGDDYVEGGGSGGCSQQQRRRRDAKYATLACVNS